MLFAKNLKKLFQISLADMLVIALIVCFGALYAIWAVQRHVHFLTGGFDLGIFDQAIWHYSRFEVASSSIKGLPNLLSDHFHPALIVLAPFYWIYPHPQTLLILQAFLLVGSVWPLYCVAKKRFEYPAVSLCLVFIYLAFWGIRAAALYDFHEVALAVPALAWVLYFIEEKRWWPMVATLFFLLCVREDMALVVAAVGVYLVVTCKNWKLGCIVMIVGLAAFAIIMGKVLPALQPVGAHYSHWNYAELGNGPRDSLRYIYHNPDQLYQLFFNTTKKQETLLYTFTPFLFLPLFSPAIFLALPLLAERFYSTRLAHVESNFQYTAYLAPILLFGTIQVFGWVTHVLRRNKKIILTLYIVAIFAMVVRADQLFRELSYNPTTSHAYVATEQVVVGNRALAMIPSEASVSAQDFIIAHLSSRDRVEELYEAIDDEGIAGPFKVVFDTDYVVFSEVVEHWPAKSKEELTILRLQLLEQNYEQVFAESGWYVLKRK